MTTSGARPYTFSICAAALGLILRLLIPSAGAEAQGKALETKVAPTLWAGVPGAENYAPSFKTLAALDEYYNAAGSGQCNDNCLAALWRDLASRQKVTYLKEGTTVWVIRRQADPDSPTYHVCRVIYYPPSKPTGINSWVLCANLTGEPPF